METENMEKGINNQFNKELQLQIEGTLPKKHIYSLGYPGINLLSAGLPNLPIELSAEKLAKKASLNYRNRHPFDLSDIKDLPKAINNPIAVFNSTKFNDNSKIILTSLQHNGNNFIVVIKAHVNPLIRKANVNVNDIKSLYPKDNIADLLNLFRSGNKLIVWLDKEKAYDFISTQSTNLIGSGDKAKDSIINIVNNFKNIFILRY